jgi:hypothetical protein
VLPVARDEISPIFWKISPQNFLKQKTAQKTFKLHLKAFNRLFLQFVSHENTKLKNFKKKKISS